MSDDLVHRHLKSESMASTPRAVEHKRVFVFFPRSSSRRIFVLLKVSVEVQLPGLRSLPPFLSFCARSFCVHVEQLYSKRSWHIHIPTKPSSDSMARRIGVIRIEFIREVGHELQRRRAHGGRIILPDPTGMLYGSLTHTWELKYEALKEHWGIMLRVVQYGVDWRCSGRSLRTSKISS